MKKRIFSEIFTRIKVQKQLYIIYFIAIFIPVTIIGSYLVYNSRSLLREHYEDQSLSDNLRVKSLLLDLTNNIYNKADSLTSDTDLIRLLESRYSDEKEGFNATESYKAFSSLLSQDTSIQDIDVYTWNTSIPEGKYFHQITRDVHSKDWFVRASSSVTPFWTAEQVVDDFHNPQLTLCLHTRIFLPKIHSYAILKITVSKNHLKNRIENSSLTTVLCMGDGSVFYSSRKNIPDHLTDYLSDNPNRYLGTIDFEGTPIIGCISSLSSAYSDDVFYTASLNYDGYSYINRITWIYFGILLLILAATSLFIYVFSHYFSRRVNTLRESMHNASLGNYEIEDSFQGEDELSEAFADLNIMIQEILRQESSVYEAQLKAQEMINQQQKMEFKMLSSQINPHFLYNTLETIRMRSLKAGNRDVANAVKLLGKSMRYVLDNTTVAFTSLDKELDYIDTYLAIQRLRFHDRVNYSLRTPDGMDLSDYRIVPLLLQPIVENAIVHGLDQVEQNGRIILHIRQKNELFYIDIFDNGCGMTLEEIDNMRRKIYQHPKESSKSIGLYNINQRIKLCYGEQYGLQIQSRKGRGTLVTVILPAEKYRKETLL
ncbi:MAG: sensor histidine kinase [Bariatricus sp.]